MVSTELVEEIAQVLARAAGWDNGLNSMSSASRVQYMKMSQAALEVLDDDGLLNSEFI